MAEITYKLYPKWHQEEIDKRHKRDAAGIEFGVWSGACIIPKGGVLSKWQQRVRRYEDLITIRNAEE